MEYAARWPLAGCVGKDDESCVGSTGVDLKDGGRDVGGCFHPTLCKTCVGPDLPERKHLAT